MNFFETSSISSAFSSRFSTKTTIARRWRHVLGASSLLVMTTLGFPALTQDAEPADDQLVPGILVPGQAAVTSFGGYLNPPNDEGVQEDRTLNPDGVVLRLLDMGTANGEWSADIVTPTPARTYTASQLGQVFGLAIDGASNPNIYVTATSLYGLRRNGTGSDAEWAEGQFGAEENAGPGTIWKIDGTTGDVSLFATVERDGVPNSGPGLGNIAFDPISQQLFVSDLDTGLIHRFDLDGRDRGAFDHGVTARPTTGVEPLPFDLENRLDLSGNTFAQNNPRSWAFAAEGRAVFGLAVQGSRLYYAASEGPQIWSVGITGDGGFDDDARLEFDLPLRFANGLITDITFTADRKIVLAQRGAQVLGASGLELHRSGNAAVFAFVPESPDDPDTTGRWIEEPQSVSVGYFEPYQQGAGGVAIGHGYTADGALDGAACKASLWVTGDRLGNAGEEAEPVEGLQGQPMSQLRSDAGLPEQISTFSIDAAPNGFDASGFLGDVEIYTKCDGLLVAELEPYEPPVCSGNGAVDDPRCLPPIEVIEPPIDPGLIIVPPPPGPDLEIVKIAQGERCFPGEDCRFNVLVRNVGDADYYGPVSFEDVTPFNEPISGYGPADVWQCAEGDFISAFCRHEDVYLAPGEGVSVELFLPINEEWALPVFENCATLTFMPWQVGADTNAANNQSCAIAPVCQPGEPGCGAELALSQITSGYCETEGLCRLSTRITNRGGEPFEGSLAFAIDDFAEGLNLQNHAPTDAWTCGPSSVGNYRCFSSPVTLEPGEQTQVDVTLALPAEYESDEAHQCAALTWPEGSGDVNTLNDRDCATFTVCRGGDCPANLALQSGRYYCTREPGGDFCRVRPYMTNRGGQIFGGPGEVVSVQTTIENTTATEDEAFFPCDEEVLEGASSTCRHELENGLLPHYLGIPPRGQSFDHRFDISGLPADQDTVEACSSIILAEGQTDSDPSDNEICVTIQICDEDVCDADMAAYPRTSGVCYRGQTCSIGASVLPGPWLSGVDTVDDYAFDFSLTKLDGLSPTILELRGFQVQASFPDATCDASGDQIICQRPQGPATGIVIWRMTAPVAVPLDAELGPREICAEITNIVGPNPVTDNDRNCRTITIEDAPEAFAQAAGVSQGLALSKRLLGACREPGSECTFRHRLTNEGTEVFEGALTLRDTLEPGGNALAGVAGQWACTQPDGATAIDCTRGSFRLGPGESEAFDITLRIPADANGALENCAQLTGDNAPASEADARSCVTITIDGDVAPPPPPPPPVDPEPEEPVDPIEPEPEPQRTRDLSLTANERSGCISGGACPVSFMVRNVGQVTYEQALTVRHTMRPLTNGLRLSRLSGTHNGYGCSGSSSAGTCTNPAERLTPGSSNLFSATITATAPANGRPSSFEVCGAFDWDGASVADTNAGVRQAQTRLNELGFNAGSVDGLKGPQTRRAIAAYQQANGLPVTNQLDATTYARLVGVSDVWGDGNPGNDSQCTVVQLPAVAAPPPPPTCTGGRFWNGRSCVCNPGLQFRGGRCRLIVVDPGPCSVSGQFRNNRGQCVCPVGTQPRGGRCRPIDTGPGPCKFPGQFRNNRGQCVCPAGQTVRQGQCRPAQQTCSIPGQFFARGQCRCPSGQQVIRGRCRQPARACTADRVLRNGECVCPTGFVERNGRCERRHGGAPPPTHGGRQPNIIPDQFRGGCPPNNIRVAGQCIPIR
jgi:hypothetical protein